MIVYVLEGGWPSGCWCNQGLGYLVTFGSHLGSAGGHDPALKGRSRAKLVFCFVSCWRVGVPGVVVGVGASTWVPQHVKYYVYLFVVFVWQYLGFVVGM